MHMGTIHISSVLILLAQAIHMEQYIHGTIHIHQYIWNNIYGTIHMGNKTYGTIHMEQYV